MANKDGHREIYQECLLNTQVPGLRNYILAAKNTEENHSLRQIEEVADFYLRELDKNIQSYLEDLRLFEEDYARLAMDVRDILDMLAFKIIKRAISKEYNG